MRLTLTALLCVTLTAPAFAQDFMGDPAKGEKTFRKCTSCHVVQNDEGEVLAGRKAKAGPNLYGVIGRTAGSVEGFRYSKSLIAAGEAGLVWDIPNFIAFVQNPSKHLKTVLDNRGARSKMSFKVRKPADAADLAAFLAEFSPAPEADDAAQTD